MSVTRTHRDGTRHDDLGGEPYTVTFEDGDFTMTGAGPVAPRLAAALAPVSREALRSALLMEAWAADLDAALRSRSFVALPMPATPNPYLRAWRGLMRRRRAYRAGQARPRRARGVRGR